MVMRSKTIAKADELSSPVWLNTRSDRRVLSLMHEHFRLLVVVVDGASDEGGLGIR